MHIRPQAPPVRRSRAPACVAAAVALALLVGARSPTRADDAPAADDETPIDAIYVMRLPAWWVTEAVDRRAFVPRWTVDGGARRVLGVEGARRVERAIEAGEGGGLTDGTGLGPPVPPARRSACGIALAAIVRDVAVVFVRDGRGDTCVVGASRLIESARGPPQTTSTVVARRGSVEPLGPSTREPTARGPSARGPSARGDPLRAARSAALLGDATATLEHVGSARIATSPTDQPSLDLLEAQALERLGRFREAADALDRCADQVSPRVAVSARDQAARVRARVGTTPAPNEVRATPRGSIDAALGGLPGMVDEGRPLEAVTRIAEALAAAPRHQSGLAPMHADSRRRALLAAAALALEEGMVGPVRVLLEAVGRGPPPDEWRPVIDALSARVSALSPADTTAPGPPVGKPSRGG